MSVSETWYAIKDHGTNYCNLYNLMEGERIELESYQSALMIGIDTLCTVLLYIYAQWCLNLTKSFMLLYCTFCYWHCLFSFWIFKHNLYNWCHLWFYIWWLFCLQEVVWLRSVVTERSPVTSCAPSVLLPNASSTDPKIFICLFDVLETHFNVPHILDTEILIN